MAKIIVVEDDSELSEMIGRWLDNDHHITEIVPDGGEALSRLKLYTYDLVVLDWNLPGMEGLDVLKQFRATKKTTPVLMLTGKSDIEDRVEGLNCGADDYLTKPFHARELLARIGALLRRPSAYSSDVLVFGDIELDSGNRKVTRNSVELSLLPKEYALLDFLMRHPARLFSADALLGAVWANESDSTREALTTCIKRLRKKLDHPGEPSVIRNVHGVGYGLFID
ncbi:MAG: response regulator transcription factor [Candidatus Obscuribacterales bacterium]